MKRNASARGDCAIPIVVKTDEAYNHIEKLRDPSHVRNYRPSEWRAMTRDAGLRILSEELDYYTEDGRPMDFATWTNRMKTPPDAIAELRKLFHGASPALLKRLRSKSLTIKSNSACPKSQLSRPKIKTPSLPEGFLSAVRARYTPKGAG